MAAALFNCHLASHGSTSRLAVLSPSLSRSYSFSLTRRLTDASPPSSSAAFRCFFVFFFAACCFCMLIFFRFLFWRPLPKQRPSALVFLCCFSYDVFFCLHTLLLVYRTKFSSACLRAFVCLQFSTLPAPPPPPSPMPMPHPLRLWRVLTATSDEFLTPTQRQLLHYVLSRSLALHTSSSSRHSQLPSHTMRPCFH